MSSAAVAATRAFGIDRAQVCNCNGVSKGQLVACVRDGQRTVGGVMAATRAGKGCGSCKGLVVDIVTAALGGDLQKDPAEGYYVPCIPMDKPALMAEIRQRGLRSPSAVFAAGRDREPARRGHAALGGRLSRPVAGAPATGDRGQFRDALSLVELPKVPARNRRRTPSRGGGMMTSGPATGAGRRLGPVDQIPLGEGRAFVVGDEQVAVFRLRDGGLRALAAVCPHRGGPLADGLIDGAQVVCPLHNHAFQLADGQCTTGARSVRAYRSLWRMARSCCDLSAKRL